MQFLHIIRYVYPTYYTLRISYILYATYIGSSWSARKPSLRCIRCFSPRELIGTTPGSTTTTTPTINCCSLSTDDVTRGTTSRASLSSASSSTTTTRRLVHVNTALRERREKKNERTYDCQEYIKWTPQAMYRYLNTKISLQLRRTWCNVCYVMQVSIPLKSYYDIIIVLNLPSGFQSGYYSRASHKINSNKINFDQISLCWTLENK